MNKVTLIIKREYLTRVKKKSFLIMSLIGPVLMAAVFVIPAWMASLDDESDKNIVVFDKSDSFAGALKNLDNYTIKFVSAADTAGIKADFKKSDYDAFVYIGDSVEQYAVAMYSDKPVGLSTKAAIASSIKSELQDRKYKEAGIDTEILQKAKVNLDVKTVIWTDEGEKTSSSELNMIIGYIASMIIYMFIFMYGVQVMRGVIEEKVSRIIEVIVSSVKPFQLMTGKIVGIALVALTQFLLWAVLTGLFIFLAQIFMPGDLGSVSQGINTGELPAGKMTEILTAVHNFNWTQLAVSFIFFFMGGYLLYAAMFAAIGAAVDNETDTQQFMLPVTIPLILALFAAQGIIRQPGGVMAQWLSMIPLTSPIIMPIRISLGEVPVFEIVASVVILIASFVFMTWLAGRIYRTGILMYGKKVSYKELWKWLKYK